jgi:hypothetical protein
MIAQPGIDMLWWGAAQTNAADSAGKQTRRRNARKRIGG